MIDVLLFAKGLVKMTKNKRFIQKGEAIINTITDELVTASSEDSAEIIVDWINKLLVKNAELSQENYGLQDGLDFYKEQNAYLSEQINELEQKLELYKNQEEQIKELQQLIEDMSDYIEKLGGWED